MKAEQNTGCDAGQEKEDPADDVHDGEGQLDVMHRQAVIKELGVIRVAVSQGNGGERDCQTADAASDNAQQVMDDHLRGKNWLITDI